MKQWADRISNLSYTDRDVSAVRTRLINYLKENYPEQITDFNESSVIMMILELLAGTSDMLNYRIDRQALESYLPTAKQRTNIKAILTSLGYRFEMATAATGTCLAQIPENSYISGNGVLVEKGTQLNGYDSEDNRYPLTVTSSVLVPFPGNDKVTVPIAQGVLSSMTLKVQDIIDSSRLYLTTTKNTSVDRRSVTVVIDDKEWQNLDDVLRDYTETNTTFSVYEDKNDSPYILFHRNMNILLADKLQSAVTVTYLETKGNLQLKENLSVSSINSFNTINNYDLSGVRFSDLSILSGGSDRETAKHAKEYAPKVFKTMDRAVTLDDFESQIGSLNGVAKVKVLDWKSTYVNTPYLVLALIAPNEGTTLSTTHIQQIRNFIEPKMLSTVTLEIRSANYVKVNVKGTIVVNGPESDYNKIRIDATKALTDEYTLENVDFGEGVNASNIITLIETSNDSIEYVDLITPVLHDEENKDALSIYLLGDIELTVKGRY